MVALTPSKLKNYVQDYDYEITLDQAKEVLDLLDNYYGTFTSENIQEATDYILNGNKSRYADLFM